MPTTGCIYENDCCEYMFQEIQDEEVFNESYGEYKKYALQEKYDELTEEQIKDLEEEYGKEWCEDWADEVMDKINNDYYQEGVETVYFGDWKFVTVNGEEKLNVDENKENGVGYAAIVSDLGGAALIQVVWSKFTLKCRKCSPCCPGQGDLSCPGCDYTAYSLPFELFSDELQEEWRNHLREEKLDDDPERFYRALVEYVDRHNASELFAVKGVYELVSEHFNNEILKVVSQEIDEEIEEELKGEVQ